MRRLFLVFFLFYCLCSEAQHQITFQYDSSGNQTNRTYCFGCSSKSVKEIKEIEAVQEDDFEKFYPEDQISYYPNPVKEELYLKWTASDELNVNSIGVYSITSAVLDYYPIKSGLNNQNLPFQSYSVGVYFVVLNYNNGEQKSIKIIKR
ncbi:T9SS type A sorting domain-containing protein [Flavobacterium sp. S87F.05.LMB.W.Kidney.N]|uniref:T9SS type A sorting domain-containing protein n=1 Tax=Flavobacterium sp. S87F.05.LMB.W.Kidney.N TaxID=1278758 RepID=UPI001066986C|nr:T9SS type A sorting domain-containing protein [Flavobacterium sp. S87F.05.LMB.W.Kidney.N]TDX11253.1 putative secreted protein (Por secretion system target) [Flavobacterium sp. S87F.05.LMB.W.Kidney.N]